MWESVKRANIMEKEAKHCQMELFTLETVMKVYPMDKEFANTQMEQSILSHGGMDSQMDNDSKCCPMKHSTQDSGWMKKKWTKIKDINKCGSICWKLVGWGV
jgi:hypothetical protein